MRITTHRMKHDQCNIFRAQSENRTRDPTLFRRVLFQLSYLGVSIYGINRSMPCQITSSHYLLDTSQWAE